MPDVGKVARGHLLHILFGHGEHEATDDVIWLAFVQRVGVVELVMTGYRSVIGRCLPNYVRVRLAQKIHARSSGEVEDGTGPRIRYHRLWGRVLLEVKSYSRVPDSIELGTRREG